ncbi:MAG: serine/threonine protein kinase [Polyangiaceae bacterium]|nr:serine/threonine protein kinase [Polyangiaceae bacterium]
MDFSPGTVIEGKYRIVRLLGQGGMGAVYEGVNTLISRRVAIKVLHASLATKDTPVERFKREAHAAGKIGSEHIVEVIDIGGLPSGELFMVMEFLEGEDLGSRIKKLRRLKPHDAAGIVHQILEGLTAAHRAGIIHRDLKPENVFLTSRAGRRDFVKVLDFGVSKFSGHDTESMSMTSTGAVVGTPYYLSPEQARGYKNIDARSDLYSVGVVLYQSVTGRLPFNAETFNELVFKIALEEPEPAEVVVPTLDRSFAAIISRAMVRDVNGRFQTAREFQEALEQWLAMNPSAEAPRPSGMSLPAAPARSGTVPFDSMEQPAPFAAPAPQPSYPSNAYAAAPGYAAPQPSYNPYAQPPPPPPQQGMPSYSAQPPGGQPAFGATPQGAYAYPGGPAAPTPQPQQGAMTPGALMMTPQPGEVPIAAAPAPKKRAAALAAAIVGVVAIAGGGLGAYMIFARGEPQGGTTATAPEASSAQVKTDPGPATPPSGAPSAGSR